MKHWVLDVSLAVLLIWSVCILASVTAEYFKIDKVETELATTQLEQIKQIDLLRGDKVVSLPLNEYLTGVLLCEVDADFHHTAKQAQAIVARTYALRVLENGIKHGKNIICDRPECCQGYIAPEEYEAKWGVSEPVASARRAVEETDGQVLTYAGSLIDATYFSCSGGTTEDAKAVWGADVPYLRSVESPGEEGEDAYLQTVTFTPREFFGRLGLELTGRPADWLGDWVYTDGGGVAAVTVCGHTFSGTQMRSRLGLRSTKFYITSTAESVLVTTKGYGHRVGMSQYGADAMAHGGASCEEILKHYYTGVELELYNE